MAEKIVIASGKGGVGKSSVTAGLARALSQQGKRVLMLDMDIGLRSLDLIFGVQGKVVFDWGDIISGSCSAGQAILKTGSADLLAAPARALDCFDKPAMKKIADELDGDYDFILFDAPAGLSDGFELACAAADRGIAVSTADAVCVRSVNIAAAAMRKEKIDDIRLIINRFEEKAVIKNKLLNIDDVIDATAVRLLGVVPEDTEVSSSATKGKALPKRSLAAKAFLRIASRICGEEAPLLG